MTVNSPEIKTEEPKVQEQVVVKEQQIAEQPQVKAEGDDGVDPNWRAFREARKKDRAEREAAERRAAEKEAEAAALRAAMEAAFAKGNYTTPQQGYQDSYQQEESEDERIEKRVNAAIAKREAEYERQRQIREQQEYPQRLQQQYPDFAQVTTTENLDYLEFHYPEVAEVLRALPEGFDKWSKIYRNVKKFVPNNTSVKKEMARAESNMNKPKSISSIGVTQPGEASGSARISEERRAENWARMQRTLKGLG